MATAMIYDTLKLAEQLEREAGFDAARAKAMARILAENAGWNLATREDLLGVRGDLSKEISVVREDLSKEISVVREDLSKEISVLREDLSKEISVLREDLLVARRELEAAIQAVRFDLGGQINVMDGKIRVLYWMTGTTLAGVATLLGTAIAIALHIMRLG